MAHQDPAGAHVVPAQRESPACLDLDDQPDAARVGRRFVQEQMAIRGASAFADDGALVAAELLANAAQHGRPPIGVCVSGAGEQIRIEVSDASPRPPVRLSKNLTNMTGRGLALVEAVSRGWGVKPGKDGGKIVWASLGPSDEVDAGQALDVDAELAAWEGLADPLDPAPRFVVVLGDVPTELLIGAKAHIDNLVREFSLASAAHESGGVDVPPDLARLIETVVHGFSEARDAIKRQALAAARRGEPRTQLTLNLPQTAADAGEAYLAALDDADEYARAARLLTLETPADHRLFRRWYVQSVVGQLRALTAGRVPPPVTPFEGELVREVRRMAASQRITDRAARLQRVTAALASTTTPEDVATVVLGEAVEALGAVGGGLLVPAPDGVHLAVPGAVGYGEALVGALREERRDAPLPAATALRTSTPVWLESQEERDREFPALRGFESSTVSMCAVPLIVGDRTLGALRFSFIRRRLFDEEERSFVLALAAQTAQTLHRTEMYRAERQASVALQRALLPEQAPEIDGWSFATYYSPAGDQEAGGDFYDVVHLNQGPVAAIVGDVMGRGIAAAAAMAQIRSTIRAYAIDDPAPLSVFRRVDTFFESLDLGQLVTVLYCLIDPATGSVQIANAGHLPPLLVDGNGGEIVPTPPGTPFGIIGPTRTRFELVIPPDAALVALTDGMVERRGEDIDVGVARIIRRIGTAAGIDAPTLLRRITTADAGELQDDDVTALVVKRSAE